MFGPILFPIFINNLPDHILRSLIDIFIDDTTLHDSVNSHRYHMQVVADLNSNLVKVSDWSVKWLVVFNASKTKLLSFSHHRGTPVFPDMSMDGEITGRAVKS